MGKELVAWNHIASIAFGDSRFELGQFFGREVNRLFTLTREDEDVRSVLELRIVHDDRALDYSTGDDFHEQMLLRPRAKCTIDAERPSEGARRLWRVPRPKGAILSDGSGCFFIEVVGIEFRDSDGTGRHSYLMVHHKFDQAISINEHNTLNGLGKLDGLRRIV